MKKKTWDDEKTITKATFSASDYDKLRAGMKEFESGKGRYNNRFLKYMNKLGVVRLEGDELFVRSPLEFTQYIDMYSNIQKKDDAELKAILDQYPEEKDAWRDKIKAIAQSFKVKTI